MAKEKIISARLPSVGADVISPGSPYSRVDCIDPYNSPAAIQIATVHTSILTDILTKLISIYQSTRFMRPDCCRFYPSCSDYCLQAIETHGAMRGIVLTAKRLLKCHPWHPGGIDLVTLGGTVGNDEFCRDRWNRPAGEN